MDNITMTLTNFEQMQIALGGERFRRILEKHIRRATGRNAKYVEREVRQTIKKSTGMRWNAPLTIAIKRTAKPLVDRGSLFQAITSHQTAWNKAIVGVSYEKDGHEIAKLLEHGAIIPVTDKMRAMFFYLWLASEHAAGRRGGSPPVLVGRAAELFARYKDWKPLSQSTRAIRIPARPFLAPTLNSLSVRTKVIETWKKAMQEAFDEAARA